MRTTAYSKTLSILLLTLGTTIHSQAAFSDSAQSVCDRPVFKLWKNQQANRLWEPNQETRVAEQSGKVYTYNCFTLDEIDQFFTSQGDRIENTHFYPILSGQHANPEEEDDEC